MSVSTPRAVVSANRLVVGAALLMSIGAAGCSSFDPADDDCLTLGLEPCTDEPAGNGGSDGVPPEMVVNPSMPAEWQCITQPDTPIPNPDTPTRVTYLTPVVDFQSPSPTSPVAVPGLQLTVCTDPSCTPPAACFPDNTACDPDIPGMPTAPMNSPVLVQQPNAAAAPFLYAINLPFGYDAVSIRARAPGYVPAEYFVGGPMKGTPEGGTTVVGLPYFLLTTAALDTLYSSIGLDTPALTANPGRGILAVRTINCLRDRTQLLPDPNARQAARGVGVRLEMVGGDPEEPAKPWVLSFGKQVRGKQSEDDLLFTDDRGTAGFANLLPLTYNVHAFAPAPTSSETGTAYGETPARVRPGVISIIEVRDGLNVWGQ
jgi:hypothetical protein